jgi:hypothetical protein
VWRSSGDFLELPLNVPIHIPITAVSYEWPR